MPLDLEKLARIEDQFSTLNEQSASLGDRYRDRVKDVEEARRGAVYRAPEYGSYSLARLNEIDPARLSEAGVIAGGLQAANRHAGSAQRLRAQLDRLHSEMAPLGTLLPRLKRYADLGLSRSE